MASLPHALHAAANAVKKPLRALRRLYSNLPIAIKLVMVLNIIILIPLITISYISYNNTEEALKTKSVQYSQDILQMVQLRLNDCISNMVDISNDLLSDERIYKTIDTLSSGGDFLAYYENELRIGSIIKNMIATRDGTQAIGVFPLGGYGFTANDNSVRENLKAIFSDDPLLYQKVCGRARAMSGSPTWVLDVEDGNVKHIFLARTMYNHDTFLETGVLVILVNPDYLGLAFDGLASSDVQNIELVSDNNILLGKLDAPVNARPAYGQMRGRGWYVDEKQQRLISYVTTEGLGWQVVSYISLKSLYADVYQVRRTIVVSCVIAVVVMSLIGLLMSVDILSPISRLVSGMERLQRGENDVVITLDRKDEIGFMGDAFNRMVTEISALEKWVYREQLTRKEAELKALQSQINPHFLFNTLETVNWMAILNDVPEISKTITALSSLMEASIMRGDVYIPLGEELTYIDNFIYILTKRFEDRLVVIKQINPAALQVIVPKLLVQPLVENAVYHGIENNRGKGRILISAQMDDTALKITVEDNGAGIGEAELAEINAELAEDDNTYFQPENKPRRKGVGLNNVNRRIKLYYGPEYGLRIESKKGEYTRILVRIPLTVTERRPAGAREQINPETAASR